MRKMEFETNDVEVERYLEQLQKKFPQYNINVNNANDFSELLKQRENCKGCMGLKYCKNPTPGFVLSYGNDCFSVKECEYKKNANEQSSKNSLIHTLYLPQTILRANLETYDTNTESRKKIYAEVVNFISKYKTVERSKGLYLQGTFSVGKTYTLACIANELAKNDIACLLIYFPDLVVDLKNAMGTSRFESLLNMLKSIDVLMLDDLGSENMTPWIRDEILGPVLNYRVLENKPVFVTSNLDDKQLIQHFSIDGSPTSKMKGLRIASRLKALVTVISMEDCTKYSR